MKEPLTNRKYRVFIGAGGGENSHGVVYQHDDGQRSLHETKC
jgi:hypothetical protein